MRGADAGAWLPLAAAITSGVLLTQSLLAEGQGWLGFVLLSLVAFPAGRARSRPAGLVTLSILLGGIAVSQLLAYDDGSIVPELMLPLTLYTAGVALRSREQIATRLADQAGELAAERDAYVRLSVRYERARIAAELHDVVAHAVSMMVVQASAGQRLADHDRSRVAETFDVIASAARQAQFDLDRLADLLGPAASGDANADLGLIQGIVETARASGLPVTLRVSGDTSGVSGAVAHTALRVVQESLTNALRYAPGAEVRVALDARPGTVELAVVNGRATAPLPLGLGTGRGLTGLRERLGACGGTLHAGPDEDGWHVRASIPCAS